MNHIRYTVFKTFSFLYLIHYTYKQNNHRFLERKEAENSREMNRLATAARRTTAEGQEANRAATAARRTTAEGQEANRAAVQRANNAKKIYDQQWDYDRPCQYCKCIWLKSEKTRNLCCHGGKWSDVVNVSEDTFSQLEPLPDELKEIAVSQCEYFSTKSAFYNGLFSSVITGVDNGREGVGYERFNMSASVTVNGRVYHKFPDSTQKNCGMANFIFDGLTSHLTDINERRARSLKNQINTDIAYIIRDCLIDINPYVEDFQTIGEKIIAINGNGDQLIPIYNASLNVQTHNMEVGILVNQDPNRGVVYKFKTKDNQNEFLNASSNEVEPLCYPLLFPDGCRGWGSNLKISKIQLMPYLAARLLQPEPSLILWNRDQSKQLNVNRFNLMSRLAQYWLVDSKFINY
jgi:hypothetical protein